ncbi:MAG TPA: hypothetical protein VK616_20985 [Flavitalea sp.]|nr:hypothetical protein [Flavitalea sp.]HTF28903.1 hypothetical protein [Flavitalea sp.]
MSTIDFDLAMIDLCLGVDNQSSYMRYIAHDCLMNLQENPVNASIGSIVKPVQESIVTLMDTCLYLSSLYQFRGYPVDSNLPLTS